METDFKLDPLYVNRRRVATLVGTEVATRTFHFRRQLSEKELEYLGAVRYAELLRDWLLQVGHAVDEFEREWVAGRLVSGRIFVFNRHVTFRNARGRQRNVEPLAHTVFPGLGADAGDLRLELAIHPDHVVIGSPGDLLERKVGDVFVCAEVLAVSKNKVTAVVIFAGHRVTQGPMPFVIGASDGEIHAGSIDNFSKIRRRRPPPTKDLEALRDISELQIKTAFAEIIDEPAVPLDWGGERSDLVTTRVVYQEQRISTAFLFKGPAGGTKFRRMEVRDLGVRGDQIERLATEPVDLLVVQHCHEISAAVRSTLRAFANQINHRRRYCLISGYETLNILRAYGKCGFGQRLRAQRTPRAD